MRFKNRTEAGRRLVYKLIRYSRAKNTLILAIPTGGVFVAKEIARKLRLPMDFIVVEKFNASSGEQAFAAASRDFIAYGENITAASKRYIKANLKRIRDIIREKEHCLRGGRNAREINGKVVIIVDDGMSSGLSMEAAIAQARIMGAMRIIAVVPTTSLDALHRIAPIVDDIACLDIAQPFWTIREFYENPNKSDDEKVIKILSGRT